MCVGERNEYGQGRSVQPSLGRFDVMRPLPGLFFVHVVAEGVEKRYNAFIPFHIVVPEVADEVHRK